MCPPASTHPEQGPAARRRGPLRPTAAIARDVLLPDDPALALALAQQLLIRPRMANHSFGLWGYTGEAKLGGELTVQAGGIGAPSLGSVVSDLAAHGASRIVRLGRCRALERGLRLGEALIVAAAFPGDGISLALGAIDTLEPDPALAAALAGAAPEMRLAQIASVDFLAASGLEDAEGAGEPSVAIALDLETAALFALCQGLGLTAGALLVVSESAAGAPLADEDLARQALELGGAAARALAAGAVQASASETASLL